MNGFAGGVSEPFVRLGVKSHPTVALAALRIPSHLETEDMQLRRIHRRLAVVAFGLGAAGLALAAPARAQEPTQQTQAGSRYQVLIPNLEHPKGVDDGFGKKVADALRVSIDKLPTHVSVSKDVVKDNLRKFKIDEKDLDCVKARQLAVQIGAELVMCGAYEPAAGGQMKVTASFVGAKNGETFEVPAFTTAQPADAAAQIFSSFDKYTLQIRSLAICEQYLGSQQWTSAVQNCNAALAINPQSARALYDKANALMNMDSLGSSLVALREVIKINPMQSDAMRMAGVVAAKMDSSALSTQYFRQYLELNPGAADVCMNLANDAAKAGNPEGGLAMVEDCMKSDTTGASRKNALMNLFAGHWALQASTKYAAKAGDDKPDPKGDSLALVALSYYNQVIALRGDSADPTAVTNAVLIMTNHNQAPQAAQLATKYLAVRHDDASLWSTYADALEKQDQTAPALAALDSAALYDKTGKLPINAKKAQWLVERGRLAEAKVELQRAVQKGQITGDDAGNLLILQGTKLMKSDPDAATNFFNAGKDLTANAAARGSANFYLGSMIFSRASAAASAAGKLPPGERQRAAVLKAAAMFREAGTYLNDTDAFLAKAPSARSAVRQYLDYIKTYTDAVKKQSGQE